MTRLIALTQLSGNYGVVQAGHEFQTDDETARELLRRAYVKHAADPEVTYETQALTPSEAPTVSARRPFRHGVVRNAKPQAVDTKDDRELPEADVRKP